MGDWFYSLGKWLSGGASHVSLQFEGLPAGWALVLIGVFSAAAAWSYRSERQVTRKRRIFLATLRALLLAGLVVFLTQPVLFLSHASALRGELLVLLDVSESMQIKDARVANEDLQRAAKVGLSEQPSRWEMVLAAGTRLSLWSRLHEKMDLVFFSLGRESHEAGRIGADEKDAAALAKTTLDSMKPNEPATALGSGIHDVVEPRLGRQLAGIFLITDGANNSGRPPLEAATLAGQSGCPLFIYGVGVTDPIDVAVSSIDGPSMVNAKEETLFKVKIKGLTRDGGRVILRANGKQVADKPVSFDESGISEVELGFEPAQTGSYTLEASVAPLANETFRDNNKASIHVRVVDEPLKVLLVEQEPRWDFQYLASMLERDRRIKARVVLLDGDPGLNYEPGSIFLPRLPEDRASLFGYQVIILGDVDPTRLGAAWMKLLSQWVSETGGALIFHAGPRFNPKTYGNTALAPLLPVESLPASLRTVGRSRLGDPVPVRVTSAGLGLPMLQLSSRPEENESLWKKFPGLRWTAPVRAKASARVLLAWGSRETPVIAFQDYGAGRTLFIGTDETYLWRSKKGEKYYTRLWGQMLESLADAEGGSGITRLKIDSPRPAEGDPILISGRVFRPGYEPIPETSIPGCVVYTSDNGGESQKTDLSLQAIPDRPGEFRASGKAGPPGLYRFFTTRDPKSEVEWSVSSANREQIDTGMNRKLLEAMAAASGGRFLREEDLLRLPDWIGEKLASGTDATVTRVELAFSPWLLGMLFLLAIVEWILRRLSQLK